MAETMELLKWATAFHIPPVSDGTPKRVRFSADILRPPEECHTDAIRGRAGTRRPNGAAISIDCGFITAQREGYRALGLLLLAYALSEQRTALRISLAAAEGEIQQVVIWPSSASRLEASLGVRVRVSKVHYRPRVPEGNPNYTTVEQDDESYPRDHLPLFSLGPADDPRGDVRPGAPVCFHIGGTGPSFVWLGKLLLNLALDDSNATLAYLYNLTPAESLAVGSAEARLVVADPAQGPAWLPPDAM